MSWFFSPTTCSALPGHTQIPQVLFSQLPPHCQALGRMLLSQFSPVQSVSAKERKIHLEEAGSFTSLMPKKRMKQLVPAQWLIQTLQKILQTFPASYCLPRVLTVKSHEHIIASEIPKQELSRDRKTWDPMHSWE